MLPPRDPDVDLLLAELHPARDTESSCSTEWEEYLY